MDDDKKPPVTEPEPGAPEELPPFYDWLRLTSVELDGITTDLELYQPEDNGALMSQYLTKFNQHMGRLSRLVAQVRRYRAQLAAPIINEGVLLHHGPKLIDLLIQANCREVWLVQQRIVDLAHNVRSASFNTYQQLKSETESNPPAPGRT